MKISSRRLSKKSSVSLTSLLDLLFVMVFLSLLQTKIPTSEVVKETTKSEIPAAKKSSPPLKEILKIQAVFEFFPTPSNPDIPKGSFTMSGKYFNKTYQFQLGGTNWIQRPESYEMIPLTGLYLEKLNVIQGKIESDGCKEFTLKKADQSQRGILGKWEGVYYCLQGETGISLLISE
jgi:hypothetical protein